MSEALEGEIVEPTVDESQQQTFLRSLQTGRGRGRPTDMTVDTVTKLIAAFNNAYNVREACQYAGISHVTYYRWLEKDVEFGNTMSIAQAAPNKRAKANIVNAIDNGDIKASQWWLERKDPEFRSKFEGVIDPNLAETRDKIKEFLDGDYTGEDDLGKPPTTGISAEAGSTSTVTPQDIS